MVILTSLIARPLSAQQQPGSGLGVECDVHRALLSVAVGGAAALPLLIVDQPYGDIQFGREGSIVRSTLRRMASPIDSALVASYFANNAASGHLHRACFAGRRGTTFGGAVARSRDDQWHTFTFSRVGFTPDLRRALVHTVYGCGRRCGNGDLVLLESEGERWVVKESTRTVVF